jgi:hypothetical protein
MAKFTPAPKNFNASTNLTDEIKNDGCQMANNSFEYAKSSIRCLQLTPYVLFVNKIPKPHMKLISSLLAKR